jgi:cytochrome d ubiquinol oxidase subunit II
LFYFVGRTSAERATLLATVGPVWDGNEVWLVAGGGSLFAAFPALYATAFSGFYLPLMVVLWLLLGRALGIEMRHQIVDPMWHQFWDVAFCASSWLLPIFFGAGLGNLVRGVPLEANGTFFAPLWTDFRVGARIGILDWYTLLVATTATALITYHGALWIALKTEGDLEARARRLARVLFPMALGLALATTAATLSVQPNAMKNLSDHPLGLLLPAGAIAALVGSRVLAPRKKLAAFVASSAQLVLQVASAAFSVFPYALTARDPRFHLTLESAAASEGTLRTMLWWWLPGILLAAGYSYYNYSRMPRTFSVSHER